MHHFDTSARLLGLISAAASFTLLIAYAITLVVGLQSLESPRQPIGDPMFTLLEVLILLLMPVQIALMASVHAWAPPQSRLFTLLGVVFMAMAAVVTCGVHSTILAFRDRIEFTGNPWMFAFQWPSVVYALDILAWDFFFPFSVLSASVAFRGTGLARAIRTSMLLSGVLALAGLAGAVRGDMQLRNIGIIGYLGGFLVVAALLGVLFHRSRPVSGP